MKPAPRKAGYDACLSQQWYDSISVSVTLRRQEGGGSPKQIQPSAEEGGSRAVIDPFN